MRDSGSAGSGTGPHPHPTAHEHTVVGRSGGGAGRCRLPSETKSGPVPGLPEADSDTSVEQPPPVAFQLTMERGREIAHARRRRDLVFLGKELAAFAHVVDRALEVRPAVAMAMVADRAR